MRFSTWTDSAKLLKNVLASGVLRCPHCLTKENHDNWHLAHPVPRFAKDLTTLADTAYTCPVELLRFAF